MDVLGKTALVTGASNGIGEHLARQLADRGANLALVARRGDRLTVLREEILQLHPELTVMVFATDLSIAGAVDDLAARVSAAGAQVDLLMNNAGVGSHANFIDEDPATLAQQIQLNVGSLVALTAEFLPGMVARGFGAVLNVASTAAFQPVPTMAVYGATKAFVLSFTEALWGETRGSGSASLPCAQAPPRPRSSTTPARSSLPRTAKPRPRWLGLHSRD